MYFGSVRFFKDLIRSIVIIVIILLLIVSAVFIYLYIDQKNKTEDAVKNYQSLSESVNLPENVNFDEIYDILKKNGTKDQQMIDVISANDPDVLSKIYNEHFVDYNSQSANSYTALYPDLYVTPPSSFSRGDNTIYLTFDDGPSENTEQILSILRKYDIKATFFCCGAKTEEDKRLLKKISDEGHKIGIHSVSHDYNAIYANVEDFLEDFNETSSEIEDATGIKPDIYRFPGGSVNNYNRNIYMQLISEITRRGYVYYDWDICAEDASNSATWTSIYNNVVKNSGDSGSHIVLMHDSKYKTVTALEDIIIALKNKGYSFQKLKNNVLPSNFTYID